MAHVTNKYKIMTVIRAFKRATLWQRIGRIWGHQDTKEEESEERIWGIIGINQGKQTWEEGRYKAFHTEGMGRRTMCLGWRIGWGRKEREGCHMQGLLNGVQIRVFLLKAIKRCYDLLYKGMTSLDLHFWADHSGFTEGVDWRGRRKEFDFSRGPST